MNAKAHASPMLYLNPAIIQTNCTELTQCADFITLSANLHSEDYALEIKNTATSEALMNLNNFYQNIGRSLANWYNYAAKITFEAQNTIENIDSNAALPRSSCQAS